MRRKANSFAKPFGKHARVLTLLSPVSRAQPRRICPDGVRQSGDSDVATNYHRWQLSRTALDQGSKNGGTRCVSSSGKQRAFPPIVAPRTSTSEEKLRPAFKRARRGFFLSGFAAASGIFWLGKLIVQPDRV